MNVLISAGPTLEPIDAVRFISNRSSGKMGVALAEEAFRRSHNVKVVHGPMQYPSALNLITWMPIETSEEMLDCLKQNFGWCDVLIMAAAVCDARPKVRYDRKVDKSKMNSIELEPNPDLLFELSQLKDKQTIVSYSLENSLDLERPLEKMRKKGADFAVINPTESMSSDGSSFRIIDNNGKVHLSLDKVNKSELAAELFRLLEI